MLLLPFFQENEPVDYNSNQIVTGKSQFHLNPNHHEFFLVDDGSEGRFGAEFSFRWRLQQHLMKESKHLFCTHILYYVTNGCYLHRRGLFEILSVSRHGSSKTQIVQAVQSCNFEHRYWETWNVLCGVIYRCKVSESLGLLLCTSVYR